MSKKKSAPRSNLPARRENAAPTNGGESDAIVRMARDPKISVEKLERLMAMQERMLDHQARAAFASAMTEAQKEMRAIVPDAFNTQTQSRYASHEALDSALRPIYTKHGFALSYNTGDAPKDEQVRVLCLVTHIGGHHQPYKIDMPADGKGAKGGDVMTKTHATGSAVTYGMRYLLKMIFNVPIQRDDDGNGAGVGKSSRRRDGEGDGEKKYYNDATANEPITDRPATHPKGAGQRQRLFVIAKKAGRSKEELTEWLRAVYGYNSTRQILRKQYDEICKAVEASAPLPRPQAQQPQGEREPGQEG